MFCTEMNLPSPASRADNDPGYPRYFRIAGQQVGSYKVFLCVGIYLGILVIAALAQSSGIPPLRVGLGSLALALIGLAGARVYHLLVYHPLYFGRNARQNVWDSKDGGLSLFGALLAMAPCSFAVARLLDVPANVFWDCLGAGILAGGFWVRLGCAFNGCCGGRETRGWWGVCLHDTRGVRRRRSFWKWLGGSSAASDSFGSGPNPSRPEITRWASWLGMDWAAFSWNRCAKPRISSPAGCASINASPRHSPWAPAALCWRGHSHRESRPPATRPRPSGKEVP
jgi:hypothetical protein